MANRESFAAVALMKRRHGDVALRERDIIDRQARHMARLVDDLMDIARSTRGNLTLQRELIQMASVVRKAVETAAPLFQDKAQVLHVEVPPSGLQIYADEIRLSQVVWNLLVNASKFSPRGGVVSLRVTSQGNELTLTVADNGMGMEDDDLRRVFDSFTQGKQELHRPRGGLGLGLAIALNLARLHHGALSAQSAGPGKGSEFKLILPLAKGEAVIPQSPAPTVDSARRSYRVLVVDDNLDAGNSIAELLREHGHRVLLAEDAVSALRLVEGADAVDAALLDIGLPGMDGYELADRLRKCAAFSGARLVALAGFGQASDARRSAERGFDAHLVKPVELPRLLQAIEGAAQTLA
jgi:CheY-like chemotaxis protein/two-component sensor histidine kinase